MTWIYDAHIHLSDPQYDDTIDHILEGMKKTNIKACCVSVDYETSLKTLELAKKSMLVMPFIGLHPEHASQKLELIVTLVEQHHKDIAGIGEIGLDPTYCKSDYDVKMQQNVFEKLLSLAERYQKPISIHSRKSLDEVMEIIPSYKIDGILLHWFDGNKKQLAKSMDLDFFVSYGPLLVYACDKQQLLINTNLEKFLIETDGPVRFAKCFDMKSAQSIFIPSIIHTISKLLRKDYDETTQLLEKNSESYLGI